MNWKVWLITHRGEKRIAIKFGFDAIMQNEVRKFNDLKWSKTLGSWHVPDTNANRLLLNLLPAECDVITEILYPAGVNMAVDLGRDLKNLPDDTNVRLEKYEYWLRSKRYSDNTIKTYTQALRSFLIFFTGKPLSAIDNNDIIRYNNEYILKNKLSASYQNQAVNAIKLFFRKIENTKIEADGIERPKRPKLLPNVLSKEEVKEILNALINTKHRTMLALIYSCGLRRSELLHLKPEDIDAKRKLILIKQGKGRKDRIAPLSEKITEMLGYYHEIYKPTIWLFEGERAGQPYDARSLSNVLKQALAKTGIKKPVSLHWLRHSYATHLLEAGTDLRYIQEILGHKSSRTTEIYTHVSTKSIQNIKSPFDDL